MNTNRKTAVVVIALAAALGALLAIPVVLGAAALWDSRDSPDTFEGVAGEPSEAEDEPDLLAAIEAAAEEAVEFEGGRYKGQDFKITSIELTASNPHITAYRVVVEPKD